MADERYLVVMADDFGIGPETSRGILDLASAGIVTGSVLLVNSPYAEAAVHAWQVGGRHLELGWHACLTLDRPVAGIDQVTSLVGPDGRFWPLGTFIRRLVSRRIKPGEIAAELRAQHRLFQELVGHAPSVVNFHHHLQIFPTVGAVLRTILAQQRPAPYLRRVTEPWTTRCRIRGARLKRLFLTSLGAWEARRQARDGFPGNDWLAGLTDLGAIFDPAFFTTWLTRIPGRTVELMCHPGHKDPTIVGRDCQSEHDSELARRVHEVAMLANPSFKRTCEQSGFRLATPAEAGRVLNFRAANAA